MIRCLTLTGGMLFKIGTQNGPDKNQVVPDVVVFQMELKLRMAHVI